MVKKLAKRKKKRGKPHPHIQHGYNQGARRFGLTRQDVDKLALMVKQEKAIYVHDQSLTRKKYCVVTATRVICMVYSSVSRGIVTFLKPSLRELLIGGKEDRMIHFRDDTVQIIVGLSEDAIAIAPAVGRSIQEDINIARTKFIEMRGDEAFEQFGHYDETNISNIYYRESSDARALFTALIATAVNEREQCPT